MTQPTMSDTNDGRVVLVPASKSRPPGPWRDDDYDVRLGSAQGQVIGRIYRATMSFPDRTWLWAVGPHMLPTAAGFEATREEAMGAFKAAWLRE